MGNLNNELANRARSRGGGRAPRMMAWIRHQPLAESARFGLDKIVRRHQRQAVAL